MSTTLPTAEEITNFYLYGSKTKPADMTSDQLIRPTGITTNWNIDVNEYMDIGAGRMAYAAAFEVVKNFFDPNTLAASQSLQPGSYTKQQILELFGFVDPVTKKGLKNAAYEFNQLNYVDDIDDHTERTYIWGTTAFSIAESARFVIDANGTRHIENFAIVPHLTSHEDFDFTGGWKSNIGNWMLLYDTVDPSRIGRTVNFTFTGTRTTTSLYYADYATSDYGIQYVVPLDAYSNMEQLTDTLFSNGTTRYLDGNRPIVYGADTGDTISGYHFKDPGFGWNDGISDHRQLKNYLGNGVTYVMGKGADTVEGTEEGDVFYGGAGNDSLNGLGGNDKINGGEGNDNLKGDGGNDTLKGDDGNDTLSGDGGSDELLGGAGSDRYVFSGAFGSDVIQDTDGQGSVVINGATMTGGKREEGNSYYEDKATGTIYNRFGSTLSIARKGSQGHVTIRNWSNGQLGIRLVDDIRKPKPVVSPIVFDLDSDGVETSGVLNKVHFDHDGDGFAELTGWAAPDDGMLVRDLNGDGLITSGRELFGSETVLIGGSEAANGFVALAELDTNKDQQVSLDEAASLKVWRDANQNGITDEGELLSLADAGVASIKTGYTNSNVTDAFGNQHKQVGSYVGTDGSTRTATDVWFTTDRADSIALSSAPLPQAVLALPDIEGYGVVRSLQQAMAQDATLLSMVTQFTQATSMDGLDTLMRDILWQWTGVTTQHPSSRGGYIQEARWLYMVEALTGTPFIQYAGTNAGTPNPGPMASAEIYAVSKSLYELMYGKLMAQTHLKALYDLVETSWDDAAGAFTANYSQVANMVLAMDAVDHTASLSLLSDFMRSLRGQGLATQAAVNDLLAGLSSLGAEGVSVIQALPVTGFGLDGANAMSGADVVIGTAAVDVLYGDAGNDTLYGLDGADDLVGGYGDDQLEGGAGNDRLFGNDGADVYRFAPGFGQDTIYNQDGDKPGTAADTIRLGVAETAVSVVRSGDNLILTINGSSDKLEVVNYFQADGESSNAVETIEFNDGHSWSVLDVKHKVMVATAGADRLNGFGTADTIDGLAGDDTLYGNGGADLIVGNVGDDQLSGDAGDDTLSGGVGYDVLDGGAGNDTYVFGLGDGHDTVREGWFGQADGTDTIRIRSGVNAGQVRVSRDRTDIILSLPGHTEGQQYIYDSIRLQGVLDQESNVPYKIEQVYFEDGQITWTLEDIKNSLLGGGEGNDVLEGYASSDELHGNGGDDTLIGQGGADNLYGDAGKDKLYGGDGDDHLDGGLGDDTLSGGSGDNYYFLNVGSGRDVVERSFEDLLAAKDTVLVPYEVGVENVDVRREGADVIFQVKGTQDSIRFKGVMLTDGLFRNYAFQYGVAGGSMIDLNALRYALLHGALGNDTLTGYASDDSMSGGAGDDVLNGAGGQDTLDGGAGNDIFLVDQSGDIVVEAAGEGFDEVWSTTSYTLSNNVEKLVLQAEAGWASATGNDADNTIVGNDSGNRLDGGLGADVLEGQGGDDTYVLDTLADQIIEAEGGGSDTVEIGLSYTLAQDLENLQLTGDAHIHGVGNDAHNSLSGNIGANRLDGLAGYDYLSGGDGNDTLDGGADDDVLAGGQGDDLFFTDSEGDRIEEGFDEGVDTEVRAFETMYLLADGVENLTLTGTIYRGNGNELDNVLIGNDVENNLYGLDGNDTLIGGGGNDVLFGADGADSLVGGEGDDYYEIDNASDTITELAGQGDDFVRSTVSWTLGANLERLAVDGNDNLTVTGNALDNGLWGNIGDNTLTGGQGNDYLSGDLGNDTYVFNKGDGQDSIDTTDYLGAVDTLKIAALDTEVLGFRYGNSMFLKIKNSTDQIGFIDYYVAAGSDAGGTYDSKIDRVEFANGVVWDQAMIQSVVDRATNNKSPTVSGSVPTLTAREGSLFSYTVPAGTITDPDPWDSITYSVKMANGASVPAWLTFDPATRVLSGTPGAGSQGTLQFILWGTDNYGYAAGTYVNMTIKAPNTAPVLSTALPDQLANEGAPFSYTVSASAFTDPDAGDTLSYAATLADGAALPSWLSFNASTRVFSGTPPVGSSGKISLKVSAKDTGNLSVSDIFDLTISVANLNRTGTAAAELLTGGAGSDTLSGLAGNDTLQGYAGNDLLDGGTGTDSLVGGLGDDTYVVDATTDVVSELAAEGTDLVQSSASYTLSANVENLTLTGTSTLTATGNALNNVLTGNSAANTLTGAGGDDTLIGGAGNDTMVGGTGNDLYVIDVTTDAITELAGEGTDTVQSAITFTLASLANVENITLTGSTAANATGNASANVLTGNSAANVLTGGAGADTLIGGAGNDSYDVDTAGDVVTEALNAGTDSVTATISYTLSANVENLTLGGTSAISGTGNDLANTLTGNAAANSLNGGAGNDTLNGGTGADAMAGGLGDDTFIVDNTSDTVTELAGEGTDLVQSAVSFTIGANVENLTLTGTTGNSATGNALNNVLIGNAGANKLTGGAGDDMLDGGSGTDTMAGGTGNDTYVINVTADVITELAGEGTDTVQSAITYTLASLANVENITLTGTSLVNATGNAAANVLTGNSAANTLTGAAGDDTLVGGAGNDSMLGGAGNDTYVVDATGDAITENANEGIDTVQSLVTRTLGTNQENLTLIGTSAINGTGNAASNVLTGNSAANTLVGGGGNDTYNAGQGNDTLTASVAASNDVYLWGRGDGADTLSDAGGTDQLQIQAGVSTEQIWLRQVGSALEVSIIGSGDSFTIGNWYTSTANQVESLRLADGKTLAAGKVQALVNAMASFTPPAAGQTNLPTDYQAQLSGVIAANWS